MTDLILWKKIENFKIDKENVEFNFSKRLARDNDWNLDFSIKVIEEYKKFIYLCCISDNQITPSDSVDQAWHLHLTYTKSYWKEFCEATLGREIHHNPTKGGNTEKKKFSKCYDSTFDLYSREFGSDPIDSIWLDNKTRFTEINFKRINTNKFWLIKKPSPNFILSVKLLTLLTILPILFIRAKDDGFSVFFIFFIIGAIILINYLKRGDKNNRGGGGSGCSDGCSSFDSDSGCSSGCSGCSGCGGCGD